MFEWFLNACLAAENVFETLVISLSVSKIRNNFSLNPLMTFCRENQLAGFYIMGTLVVKRLKASVTADFIF